MPVRCADQRDAGGTPHDAAIQYDLPNASARPGNRLFDLVIWTRHLAAGTLYDVVQKGGAWHRKMKPT